MIYIDTSSLLKTLWEEPESPAVRQAVASESHVLVSTLTELEVEVQLRAKRLGGAMTNARYSAYRARLASFRTLSPFEFRDLSGDVFRLAVEDHLAAKIHCRTLDRLHLSAMRELEVRRLLTNDLTQADAAQALGYEVITPGI